MFTLIITLITYLFLQLRTSAVKKGARGGAVGEEERVTQGTAGGGEGRLPCSCCLSAPGGRWRWFAPYILLHLNRHGVFQIVRLITPRERENKNSLHSFSLKLFN